ncbi:MFS transporter [Peterkaempfera bronchialis]|uniref:MFS transporter n=1 Tax=Peterkaempfera bronchialis TaxID=2126346 RepID=A0A345SXW5_9ACTN|nr:MFS transporter [Peterkaempfera bronchialis]AXI78570.1 MFS transporter [Peterkaempfera bronchialis]
MTASVPGPAEAAAPPESDPVRRPARCATAPAGEPPGGRAAWLAWGIGACVYALAVVHRTSLGVAGLDAADRFGVGASALSAFSILQVLVYAAMQIPVGLLVDRLGPRRVLTFGVVLLTLGQLGFAQSTGFAPALVSRAVLGCGDAMTFVSVLRLAARWFPARRNPLIAQITGLVGLSGNLVSTAVLAQLLHSRGWTATFTATALLGIAVLALVATLLRDSPESGSPFRPRGRARTAADPSARRTPRVRVPVVPQIRAAWREPGTRLGMWVHFTTQFPANAFGLLWGMPYLVEGQQLSRGTAAGLLTLLVVSSMACGLLFGQLVSRRPGARTPIVLTVVLGTGALWAVALAWPGGHPPMWLLVTLITFMGSNGSASLVGFDYARPANPVERLGTASGIVNVGGFVATAVTLLGIGVLLDAVSSGGVHTADSYRWAFCWLYGPMLLGLAMIARLLPAAARREAERASAPPVTAYIPAAREG